MKKDFSYKKKKRGWICLLFVYAFFLSIKTAAIAIATIIAMAVAAKYISNGGNTVAASVGTGVAVAGASVTPTDVAAKELPYESSPTNVAVTAYCPGNSGCHMYPKVPL
jgi:hypothetical protein